MGNLFTMAQQYGQNPIGFLGGQAQNAANAFTPQNNLQGQTPLDQTALQGQVTTSQGNLAGVNSNQNQLAQALLAESQGQGPNPALAALHQATDQNIQQGTGMIASQKGINPALAAIIASKNAGAANQAAAGQAATLQAGQQLGAQQGLGNVYAQQAGQNLQGESTAGQLATQGSLGAQGITAGAAAQNAAAKQNTTSGLLNGAGKAVSMFAAHGGTIPQMSSGSGVAAGQPFMAGDFGKSDASDKIANSILAAGGVTLYPAGMSLGAGGSKAPATVDDLAQLQPVASGNDFMSKGLANKTTVAGGPFDAGYGGPGGLGSGQIFEGDPVMASKGAIIPSHLHPIAKIYHPNFQAKNTKMLKSKGGDVPGKAKIMGDSPKNDTVKTMLSPGEVVIPRSVMESDDPAANAAKFVANELRKHGSPESSKADFKDALKKAIGQRKYA